MMGLKTNGYILERALYTHWKHAEAKRVVSKCMDFFFFFTKPRHRSAKSSGLRWHPNKRLSVKSQNVFGTRVCLPGVILPKEKKKKRQSCMYLFGATVHKLQPLIFYCQGWIDRKLTEIWQEIRCKQPTTTKQNGRTAGENSYKNGALLKHLGSTVGEAK